MNLRKWFIVMICCLLPYSFRAADISYGESEKNEYEKVINEGNVSGLNENASGFEEKESGYLEQIIEAIYAEAVEDEREVDFEELQEELQALASKKIDLNKAKAEDLEKLLFLTDYQVDNILIYADEYGFVSVYDLLLVNGLKEYDVQYMLPFVMVTSKEEEKIYLQDVIHYSKHEIDLRADARNIENNMSDPFYAQIKYKGSYSDKFSWGLSAEHDVGEPWYSPHKTYGFDYYGGYFQWSGKGCLSNLVVGDYRASFGQGLVINNGLQVGGKSNITSKHKAAKNGLKKYGGTGEYDFLRGVGATVSWKYVDLTAFYSAKKVDGNVNNGCFPSIIQTGYHLKESEIERKRSVWQQVAGINATFTYKTLQIGITAIENALSDTLKPKATYYSGNYFHGKNQFSAGLNYYYRFWKMNVFGEIGVSQNSQWGWANITGIGYRPVNDVNLTLLYRYYSATYDNMYANAFGETSRVNDENGLYAGAEITSLKKWKFSLYADGWYFAFPKSSINSPSEGWDFYFQTQYYPNNSLKMSWKARAKSKYHKEKYTLQYQLNWSSGGWQLHTHLEGNLARKSGESSGSSSIPDNPIYDLIGYPVIESSTSSSGLTWGLTAVQDVAYNFRKVPITLQVRLQGFDARHYDNRLYAYENDVLYAMNIPMVYGLGGRWYLNFRYKAAEWCSIYLKAMQTLYNNEWASAQHYASNHVSEVHLMLKFKW